MRIQRGFRRLALGAALCLFGAAAVAQDAAPPPYAEAVRELERIFAAVAEGARATDRRQFDPAARAEEIGPDPERLFAFVRDWIAFHPYRGTLRHAAGTLMSRAGNSCDKSLLLAEMLRRHGHKTRFARATLDEATARTLVAYSDRPASADSRSALGAETRGAMKRLLERLGVPAAEIAESDREALEDDAALRAFLVEALPVDAANLAGLLARAGIAFEGKAGPGLDAAIAAARDHCWVQLERGGQWVDLDPAAFGIAFGARIAAPEATLETLPAALAHTLRLRVVVERLQGGAVERDTVLERGVPLDRAVNHIALHFTPENAGATGAALPAPGSAGGDFRVVWPILRVDGRAVSGDPFDLAGRKLARDPRQRSMGAIGGALGGPPPSLRRVVLHIAIAAPDGTAREFERVLAERAAGAPAAADANLRLQLLGTFDLAATGARIDEAYLVADLFARLGAARAGLEQALRRDRGLAPSGAADPGPALAHGAEPLAYLFARGALLESRIAAEAPSVIAFAAEPQLVVFRRRVAPGAGAPPVLSEGFDIVVNALRVYDDPQRRAGIAPRAAAFAFEQGIADTLLEFALLGEPGAANAHPVFAAALGREGAAAVVTIKPGDAAAVAALPIGADAKRHMMADLGRGFAVLAPLKAERLEGAARYAWWRVHPETGETLGIGPTGEGQTTTDTAILVAAQAMNGFALCAFELALFHYFAGYQIGWGDAAMCVASGVAAGLVQLGIIKYFDRVARAIERLYYRAGHFRNRMIFKARQAAKARAAAAAGRKPVIYTPKPPASGVKDALGAGGPARPGPFVDPKAPTATPLPGSMTPTRPAGPHGTEVVKVPWTTR